MSTPPSDGRQGAGATITAVRLTPTHDAEVAMVIELTYANGGRATVHVEGSDAVAVMARAGVGSAAGLVGQPWTVLQVRDVAGPGGAG